MRLERWMKSMTGRAAKTAAALLLFTGLLPQPARADYDWGNRIAVYKQIDVGDMDAATTNEFEMRFTPAVTLTNANELRLMLAYYYTTGAPTNDVTWDIGIQDAGGAWISSNTWTPRAGQTTTGQGWHSVSIPACTLTVGTPYKIYGKVTIANGSRRALIPLAMQTLKGVVPLNDDPDPYASVYYNGGSVAGAEPLYIIGNGSQYIGQPYARGMESSASYGADSLPITLSVKQPNAIGQIFQVPAGGIGLVGLTAYAKSKDAAKDVSFKITSADGVTNYISTTTFFTGDGTNVFKEFSKTFPGVYLPEGSYRLVFFDLPGGETWFAVADTKLSGAPYEGLTYKGATGKYQTSADQTVNWSNPTVPGDLNFKFKIDDDLPTMSILQPLNNTWRKSVPSISGTAKDNYYINAGGVKLFIKEEGITSRYWTGSAWTTYSTGYEYDANKWISTAPASASVGATVSWSYANPGWSHDRRYVIYARTMDSAGNYTQYWSTSTFYYDLYAAGPPENPDSRVLVPSPDSVIESIPAAIGGTASDNALGGVSNVKWVLWRNSDNAYWMGSWTPGPVPSDPGSWPDPEPGTPTPAGGTPVTWNRTSILPTAGDMTDGVTYYMTSVAADRVVDSGNNSSPNYEVNRTTVTFWWDVSAPVSITTMPASGARYSSLTGIFGTAYDNVKIDSLRVRMRRNSDNKYWNDSANEFGITDPEAAWVTLGTGLAQRTTNWSYTDIFDWTGSPATEYQVNVQAKDYLRYETAFSTVTFTYDLQAPSPAVTNPPSLGYVTAPLGPQTTIQGTVDMDASLVQVRLQDLAQGTTYWNGSAWQNSEIWVTANIYAPGFWRLLVPPSAFVSGRKYQVNARATDSSIPTPNVGTSAAQLFWYDVQKPTAAVTGLATGSLLPGLASIAGTAWDTGHFGPVGSSLDRVEISIYSTQLSQYFTGSGWGAVTPLAVSLDGGDLNAGANRWEHAWTITPSTGWINNYEYHVRYRAVDKAGNAEPRSLDADVNPTDYISFTIDLQAPASISTFPANGGIYGAGNWTLYGTASDNKGLDLVELSVKRSTSTDFSAPYTYWNGAFWQDDTGSEVWISSQNMQNLAVSNLNWSYGGIAWTSGKFRVRSRARDDVARVQTQMTDVTFTVDMTAPSSLVITPAAGGAYNASGLSSLQGQAEDDLSGIPASGVQIWIKDLGPTEGELPWPTTYWNGSAWQNSASPILLQATPINPGALSTPWTYPRPSLIDGHRYEVQSKASDIAGNAQVPSGSNTFDYDVNIPTAAIGNPPNGGALSSLPEITGEYTDTFPGSEVPANAVKISIRQNFGSQLYWKGSVVGWEGTSEYWLDVSVTPTEASTDTGRGAEWNYADTPPWEDQRLYRIRAKAVDSAGNAQEALGDSYIAVSTFTYDASAPQTMMYAPVAVNRPRYDSRAVDTVQGVSTAGGTEIDRVEIQIYVPYDATQSYFWQFPGYTSLLNHAANEANYWKDIGIEPQVGPLYWRYAGADMLGRVQAYSTSYDAVIKARTSTAQRTEVAAAGERFDPTNDYTWSIVDSPLHGTIGSGVTSITGRMWPDRSDNPWAIVLSIYNKTTSRYWDQSMNGGLGGWSGSGSEIWNPAVRGSDLGEYYAFSFNASGVTWTTGEYVIRSRWTQNNRVEVPHRGSVYIVDVSPPDSRVLVPSNNTVYSALPYLNGTAADVGPAGLQSVDAALKRLAGGTTYYWNAAGPGWSMTETPVWNGATMAGSSWTFNTDAVTWDYENYYTGTVRGTDKGGNVQTAIQTGRTFMIDNTGPSSQVTFPADGEIYSTVATITGTAYDKWTKPADGQMRLLRQSPGAENPEDMWNGSEWEAYDPDNPAWFPVDSFSVLGSTASLGSNFAPAFWTNGYKYFVSLRSKDSALGAPNQGLSSPERVFWIDNQNPSTLIQVPTSAPRRTLTAISGTALDNRKLYVADTLNTVNIRLFRVVGSLYWNFQESAWDECDPEGDPPCDPNTYFSTTTFSFAGAQQSSGTFSYSFPGTPWASGYVYRVEARSRDYVGNYDTVYSTVSFKFDDTEPLTTVVYPAEGVHYQAISTASIAGTSVDPSAGSGVTQVKVYLQDLTQGATYWSGVAWTENESQKWLFASQSGNDWSWIGQDYGVPVWQDGHAYRFVSRARDAATNEEGAGAGNYGSVRDADFVYDISRPTGTVTYPANKGYISQTGRITGTAYDAPSGIVERVYVRVRQTSGANPGHYYRVSDSSWTVENSPEVWNDLYQGGPYGTLSPSATWWQLTATPWQSGEIYEIDVNIKDKAGWYRVGYSTMTQVKADFDAPSSTVTYPAHGASLQEELTVISGSASDAAPGEIDKVLVSYYCNGGICSGNYWNRAAGAWNSAAEIFYEANYVPGNNTWTATGVSTPTWTVDASGINYRIFAKAVDKAGNEVAKPGTPGPGPHIEFNLKTPGPSSGITVPDEETPHWNPSLAPALSGTAVFASAVELRIIDYGADNLIGTGDDLAWDGDSWEPAGTYAGYVPASVYNSPNWQWGMAAGNWNTDRLYRVKSRAVGASSEPDSATRDREFVMDAGYPSASISVPSAAYAKSVPFLSGTAWDEAPGVLQNYYFRVRRQESALFWNWSASTFTAAGADTELPAYLDGGLYKYTTDYFQTGQAFETNRGYIAQLFARDKAGNLTQATDRSFIIDKSSPSARILVPYDANGSGVRSMAFISGTASDNQSNASVQVAVQKWVGETLVWFDGSGFTSLQAAPYWITVNGTNGYLSPSATSWSYAPAGFDNNFESGYRYLVLTRALDTAGNVQETFTVDVSSLIARVDKNPPSSVIVSPLDSSDGESGRYKASAIGQFPANHIRGTATDNPAALAAGLQASQMRLSYLLAGDTYYWSGAAFSSGAVAEAAAWRSASITGSAPVWNWDYTSNVVWPAGDREYLVETRGMDDARAADDSGDGNWEQAPYVSRRFIVDDTPPAVSITTPTELSLNSATDIYGEANADIAGLAAAYVRISTGTGASISYWNGTLSSWVSSPDTWNQAEKLGPTSWYYTVSPSILVQKTTYTVSARALDFAGNYSVVYATRAFLNQRPSDVILNPYSAAYNSLTSLSGEAFDNTGVTAAAISVFNYTQSRCYDPSVAGAWRDTGCSSDNDAPWVGVPATIWTSSASWSYAISNSSWTSGAYYRVRARSRDAAGNWNVVLATASFQFDTEIPVSTVTYPADGSHLPLSANPVTIQGTAGDWFSGVTGVKFYLRKYDPANPAENGYYWNGIGWIAAANFLTGALSYPDWSYGLTGAAAYIDGARYTAESWATDLATNEEALTLKSTFVYDVSRPTAAIAYPYDGGYVSETGRVTGDAYDKPYGRVANAFVRIKRDDNWYWSSSLGDWTLAGAPEVWNDVLAYGALSPGGTWWQLNAAPWESGRSYEVNAYVVDKAGNQQLVFSTATGINADFTAPVSTVTYPVHGSIVQAELSVLSGSASDIAGVLDKVRISYYCVNGSCGGNYWNRSAMAWNSPTEIFYDAAILTGSRWEATGVSTPAWISTLAGVDYRVFAKGVDQAGNEVAKPGSPAADSPYIQFTLRPPPPDSAITTPTGTPHWKTSPSPTIIGTAIYATTVQIRIVDYGPDLEEKTGGDDLAWNGSAWVSTNVFTGYVGVTNFSSPNWQWTMPGANWTNNRRYRVYSLAKHETNGIDEQAGDDKDFAIDDTAPSATVTSPDRAFVPGLAQLAASVSDIVPGQVQSAYFRVKRQENAEYWDWRLSTFTLTGENIDLPAAINAGIASYTTAYFQAGLAWQTDRSYQVQLFATDKAGNQGSSPVAPFTIDRSSPSAKLLAPSLAVSGGIRSIPSLSGEAGDDWDNSNVQVALQQWGSPQLWYGDEGFQIGGSAPNWMSATYLSPDATSWVFAPAGLDTAFEEALPGTPAMRYLLLVRATDTAGNIQDQFQASVPVSSMVVTVDRRPPSSWISFPADMQDGVSGRYRSSNVGKSGTRFFGAASDSYYSSGNAGVAASRIRLTYLLGGDTWYWMGASFSSGTAAEQNSWRATNLTANPPDWDWVYLTFINWPAGDREYKLESKTMDASRPAGEPAADGNWEDPQSRGVNVRYFIVDDTPPSVLITSPTFDASGALAEIRGDANADIAGFKRAEIKISTSGVEGTRYWTGAAWSLSETWINSTKQGPTSWYYTVPPAMLVDDKVYTAVVRAVDYADNFSAVYSTKTFTYDLTGPLVSMTHPENNATYSLIAVSTPLAGGTANNQTAPYTGASTVAVAVTDLVTGECFNGAAFAACADTVWLPAQGAVDNWTFSDADISFVSDRRYRYQARATDIAGNHSAVTSVEARYDLDIPTSTVVSPAAAYVKSLSLISGTVSDERYGARTYEAGLGTYTVKVAVRLVGGNWWNGTDAFNSANPRWYETAVDTAPYGAGEAVLNWTYAVPGDMQGVISGLGRKDYLVVPWAYDLALNREFGPGGGEPANADVPAGVGRLIRYDNVLPVAESTAPADAGHYNSVPSLYGIAYDTGAVAGVHVMLKARGSFNATWRGTYDNAISDWDDTAAKYTRWSTATYNNGAWTIPLPSLQPVNNLRFSVWVRAIDAAGNWQATPSNAQIDANLKADNSPAHVFTFDNTIPVTGVTAPSAYALAVATGLITGTSFDAGTEPSGVSEVRLRFHRSDGAWWSFLNDNWISATQSDTSGVDGSNPWTKPIVPASQEDGYRYDIYHAAKDQAGNNSTGFNSGASFFSTYTFITDYTAPSSSITFPADNSFIGAVTSLEGTADDSVENLRGWSGARTFESGITAAGVVVALQRLSDNYWWNGSNNFVSGSMQWHTAAFSGVSSGTWTYPLPAGAIADGATYYAMSRVTDIVGNLRSQWTTNYFTGDTTLPNSKALAPTGTQSTVNSISGTAQDAPPGELRSQGTVLVALRQISPLVNCYNGSTFVTCPAGSYPGDRIWISTGTTGDPTGQPAAWTWNTALINWANNADYDVQALAVDRAGNTRPYPGASSPDLTFRFVSPSADTVVTQPDTEFGNYRGGDVLSVLGTGVNLRAANSVAIRVKRLKEPASWWYEPSAHWVANDTWTYVGHTAGSWSMGISGSSAFTVDNASYTLSSVGYNAANEAEVPPTERSIIIDNTVPQAAILSPASPYIRSLPATDTVTGTAADPGRADLPSLYREGMSHVRILIKDTSAGTYWNGTSFAAFAPESELAADIGGLPAWTLSTDVTPALRDGRNYRFFAKPYDKAGNRDDSEALLAQYDVIFDTAPPVSRINYPAHMQVLRALSPLAGTASDPVGAYAPNLKSDLGRVTVQIYDEAGVKWWHHGAGAFSVLSSSFNIVSGTDTWSYTHPSLEASLETGKYYVLRSSAVDRAGNPQTSITNAVSSITFVWDRTAPEAFFAVPADGGRYRPSVLTGVNALNGTASDAPLPGISDQLNKAQINLSYLQGGDTYYWTGAAFSSWTVTFDGAWQDVLGAASWNYPFDGAKWVSDREYTLLVRAFDKAEPMGANGGNESDWTEVRFVVDGSPPVSRVSVPTAGSYVQSSLAEISGTSYGGLSGLQSGASGLRLRAYYTSGVDTYYWRGTAALGWSLNSPVDLPVNFTASASTVTWTYPPVGWEPPVISTNNQVYNFSISGQDLAGNSGAYAAIAVTSDFNYPTITISTPMAGNSAFYGASRAIVTLRGDSDDSPAGIVPPLFAQVSNISEPGAVKPKWDGSQWSVVDSTRMAVAGLLPWTFSSPAWPENKRFRVELSGLDAAGNSVPDGTYTRDFIYDVNRPSSSIIGLGAAGFRNPSQIATLSGTAMDWVHYTSTQAYSGLLPDGIQVQVINPAGLYYSGSAFGGDEYWRTAVFTADPLAQFMDPVFGVNIVQSAGWTYPKAPDTWPPALVEGSTYTVRVRAMDRSLNLENYVQASFCYDASAPTATVTMPGDFAYKAMTAISGTVLEAVSALDPVSGVQIAVQRDSDENWWNGTGWDPPLSFSAAAHWRNATSAASGGWEYADAGLNAEFANLLADNEAQRFRVYVRARDVTGNVSRPDAAPASPDSLFTVDPIIPRSMVTAPPVAAYLNAPIASITGTASDWSWGFPSGLNSVRMRFSRLDSGGTRSYYNWASNNWSLSQSYWTFQSVNAGLLDPWEKSIPSTAFTGANSGDGYRFEIQSESRDNTQSANGGPNIEVAYATSTFVIDFSTPAVHIATPAHQSFFSVMPSLSGTAADPAGPGGLAA
ncbi:MAG TPA: hypothetical protein DDW67_00235, partial [Elusimicrobia bacterium]|nr:hypothetical protein [Elusimicrobiota bacterium]